MKCKNCKYLSRLKNTDECGQGVCSFGESWFPVTVDNECIYSPKPYTCGDCDRYGTDYACYTVQAEDSAYYDGQLCGGFIDRHEVDVQNALSDWSLRGYNAYEKFLEVFNEWQKEFKVPWGE